MLDLILLLSSKFFGQETVINLLQIKPNLIDYPPYSNIIWKNVTFSKSCPKYNSKIRLYKSKFTFF